MLEDGGFYVDFETSRRGATRGEHYLAFERRGGLYVLKGRVLGPCVRGEGLDMMPIEQGGEGDESGQQEPVSAAGEAVREVTSPEGPAPREQRLHGLTHLPHRAWCSRCVRARGRDEPHHAAAAETRMSTAVDEVPVIQLDYTFMGDAKTWIFIPSLYMAVPPPGSSEKATGSSQ